MQVTGWWEADPPFTYSGIIMWLCVVHRVVGLLGVCIRGGGGSCKNFMRMKESSGIERLMFLMNITRLILIQ